MLESEASKSSEEIEESKRIAEKILSEKKMLELNEKLEDKKSIMEMKNERLEAEKEEAKIMYAVSSKADEKDIEYPKRRQESDRGKAARQMKEEVLKSQRRASLLAETQMKSKEVSKKQELKDKFLKQELAERKGYVPFGTALTKPTKGIVKVAGFHGLLKYFKTEVFSAKDDVLLIKQSTSNESREIRGVIFNPPPSNQLIEIKMSNFIEDLKQIIGEEWEYYIEKEKVDLHSKEIQTKTKSSVLSEPVLKITVSDAVKS